MISTRPALTYHLLAQRELQQRKARLNSAVAVAMVVVPLILFVLSVFKTGLFSLRTSLAATVLLVFVRIAMWWSGSSDQRSSANTD